MTAVAGQELTGCGQWHWVLFDLDGTVYPVSTGLMDLVSQRIQAYMMERLPMGEAAVTALRSRYMRLYGTSMRGLMLEYGIDPENFLEFVHDVPVAQTLSPNPRLAEVLGHLPWRKAIFTNSTHAHVGRVLEALGLDGQFERVFDVTDVHYVSKPDPAAYLSVLQALGAPAQECIVVDDSLPNLHSARGLGMTTVWVGSGQPADGVDWAIPRIEDIAMVAQACD